MFSSGQTDVWRCSRLSEPRIWTHYCTPNALCNWTWTSTKLHVWFRQFVVQPLIQNWTAASTMSSTTPSQTEIIELDSNSELSSFQPLQNDDNADQADTNFLLTCELASSQENVAVSHSTPSSQSSALQSKAAWSSLFAPVKPPNCTVHGEPTKRWTVNKPEPHKCKAF